jgi:hypothetical protein
LLKPKKAWQNGRNAVLFTEHVLTPIYCNDTRKPECEAITSGYTQRYFEVYQKMTETLLDPCVHELVLTGPAMKLNDSTQLVINISPR